MQLNIHVYNNNNNNNKHDTAAAVVVADDDNNNNNNNNSHNNNTKGHSKHTIFTMIKLLASDPICYGCFPLRVRIAKQMVLPP